MFGTTPQEDSPAFVTNDDAPVTTQDNIPVITTEDNIPALDIQDDMPAPGTQDDLLVPDIPTPDIPAPDIQDDFLVLENSDIYCRRIKPVHQITRLDNTKPDAYAKQYYWDATVIQKEEIDIIRDLLTDLKPFSKARVVRAARQRLSRPKISQKAHLADLEYNVRCIKMYLCTMLTS